jgi:hypothetical protein
VPQQAFLDEKNSTHAAFTIGAAIFADVALKMQWPSHA